MALDSAISEGVEGEDRSSSRSPLCNALLDSCPSFLQPVTLDLSTLLTANGLSCEWATQKALEKLACVVHLILEGAHRDSRHDGAGYYVPLHSRRLGEVLGTHYAPAAVKALQTLKVIEANDSYCARRFSKSYRLTEAYRDAPLTLRPIRDSVIARNLRCEDNRRTLEAVGCNPARRAVWDSLRTVTLSPEAFAYADAFDFTSPNQRAAWLLTLRDFAQGWHWLRADENTGRIFHNVTQCPRKLRPFLRIGGEAVAEVDIASAQPFFALSLFPPGHRERAAYSEAVTAGDFYATIFELLPRTQRRSWGSDLKAWGAPGSTHRDRFKGYALQHVFYSAAPTFESLRPVFTSALARISPWLACDLSLRRQSKSGASALARRLQKAEANLILGHVIPRIVDEIPECRAISIHDGLLCQSRFAHDVKKITEEESARMFGTHALVRVKRKGAAILMKEATRLPKRAAWEI